MSDLRLSFIIPLIVIPVAVTLASYVLAHVLHGPISASPRVYLAPLSSLFIPEQRADSWSPMLHAISLVHQSGQSVYDTLFFGLHEKFQYPLTSLLWLEGLGTLVHLDEETLNCISRLIFAFNAAGCVLLLRWNSSNTATLPRSRQEWIQAAAIFAVAYAFWPTAFALFLGQIQVWIDLLFTAALILWRRDARTAAGILIGLACTMKPQLGVLLLWGLLWREWKFALGVAVTALAAALVSVARYGLANNLNYLDVLAFISRHGESYHQNQSVNGLLNRLFFLGNNTSWVGDKFAPFDSTVYLATIASSLLFVGILLGLAIYSRGRRAGVLDLGLGGLCCSMASPVVWEHHYGIMLPVYLFAFCHVLGETAGPRRRVLLATLWSSWLLTASNLQVLDGLSETRFNVLQSPVFFGAIVLLAILVVLCSRSWPAPLRSMTQLTPRRAGAAV